MRHVLTSVFLIVLMFPALAVGEEVTMDDLVITDGLYYKKFTDVPFTGDVTERLLRATFRNGKLDGPWVGYHDNGRLEGKGTYKDGKEDGPWVRYYANGQLHKKGTYKDGKEDGPWVFYDDNGQLLAIETYKGGKEDGPWVFYDDNGQLRAKVTFKDGVKVSD